MRRIVGRWRVALKRDRLHVAAGEREQHHYV
jgi:hypothetical protein